MKRLRDLAQAKDARIAELERENKVMAALVETIGNAFNEAGVKIFAETQKARAALAGGKDEDL